VIEQKDGSRREFLMSNVRKVTVENGEIVVEINDGVTQRISMAQVARMSIGP
jgi:coenzyme F420-reducing hydrogenase beta subunit